MTKLSIQYLISVDVFQAVGETPALAAELSSARRPWRPGEVERMSGDHPQQGPGGSEVEEGATLQRQEQRPLRGHLPHHPQRQVRDEQGPGPRL